MDRDSHGAFCKKSVPLFRLDGLAVAWGRRSALCKSTRRVSVQSALTGRPLFFRYSAPGGSLRLDCLDRLADARGSLDIPACGGCARWSDRLTNPKHSVAGVGVVRRTKSSHEAMVLTSARDCSDAVGQGRAMRGGPGTTHQLGRQDKPSDNFHMLPILGRPGVLHELHPQANLPDEPCVAEPARCKRPFREKRQRQTFRAYLIPAVLA